MIVSKQGSNITPVLKRERERVDWPGPKWGKKKRFRLTVVSSSEP